MMIRLIGALLVIVCCGGFGIKMASRYRSEISTLQALDFVLSQMRSELQYRLTPLPALCTLAANNCEGILSRVLGAFAKELQTQAAPNASHCMAAALSQFPNLPPVSRELLNQFGCTAGRFDLDGQLAGIQYLHQMCCQHLQELQTNRSVRLRNYQTLGLCAGAALVIIFI